MGVNNSLFDIFFHLEYVWLRKLPVLDKFEKKPEQRKLGWYPVAVHLLSIVLSTWVNWISCHSGSDAMGLLPDTLNCGLRMRRECRERFPRHRPQRKPLVYDPGMHDGTCVTFVPWCMPGSLTRGGGKNVPVIPGARVTCYFTYLARGP